MRASIVPGKRNDRAFPQSEARPELRIPAYNKDITKDLKQAVSGFPRTRKESEIL
jgi:hypothetical protein